MVSVREWEYAEGGVTSVRKRSAMGRVLSVSAHEAFHPCLPASVVPSRRWAKGVRQVREEIEGDLDTGEACARCDDCSSSESDALGSCARGENCRHVFFVCRVELSSTSL